MNLTRDQKIEAYTYAMLAVVAKIGIGGSFVCINLKIYLRECFGITNGHCSDVLEYFPEFSAQKPNKILYVWWDSNDDESRLTALASAIALVESKTENNV